MHWRRRRYNCKRGYWDMVATQKRRPYHCLVVPPQRYCAANLLLVASLSSSIAHEAPTCDKRSQRRWGPILWQNNYYQREQPLRQSGVRSTDLGKPRITNIANSSSMPNEVYLDDFRTLYRCTERCPVANSNTDLCSPSRSRPLYYRLFDPGVCSQSWICTPQTLFFAAISFGNPHPATNATLITKITSTITALLLSSHLSLLKFNRPCASSAFHWLYSTAMSVKESAV
jgi:hypothetical protein